jgi:hypothetical protein
LMFMWFHMDMKTGLLAVVGRIGSDLGVKALKWLLLLTLPLLANLTSFNHNTVCRSLFCISFREVEGGQKCGVCLWALSWPPCEEVWVILAEATAMEPKDNWNWASMEGPRSVLLISRENV